MIKELNTQKIPDKRQIMEKPITFSISKQSVVLTPQKHKLTNILRCLETSSSILARQSDALPTCVPADDAQFLFCETSGSSGSPKIIRRQPETWIRSFDINRDKFCITPADTYAVLGDLGHSLSLFATLEALHIGADISILSGLLPKTQVRHLINLKISVFYSTPTQLRLLLTAAKAAEINIFPDIRLIFTGGGKIDTALRQNLHMLFPQATVREFYGASETSFITISDDATPEGSVGLAYPGVTMRIGLGNSTRAFETGEIWVASPYLFDGYEGLQADDMLHDDGFFSIGEFGYIDGKGYLFLRGRKSRMVTVSDKNVFPEEIETSVMQCPKVELCAALSLPDSKRGNQIICVVQGQGSDTLERELRRRCRKDLGPHAVPRRFIFLAEIPQLAAGKPDISALYRHLGQAV